MFYIGLAYVKQLVDLWQVISHEKLGRLGYEYVKIAYLQGVLKVVNHNVLLTFIIKYDIMQ